MDRKFPYRLDQAHIRSGNGTKVVPAATLPESGDDNTKSTTFPGYCMRRLLGADGALTGTFQDSADASAESVPFTVALTVK